MSLDSLLAAIRKQGDEEVQAIQHKTHAQAETMLAQAEQEAEQIQQKIVQQEVDKAQEQVRRIQQRAQLDASLSLNNKRYQLVNEVFDRLSDRLSAIRSDPDYPQIMSRLLKEALKAIQSEFTDPESIILSADPRDQKLVLALLKEQDLDIDAVYDQSCLGGLLLSNRDRSIMIDNTLESRLARAYQPLQRFIWHWLFEEDGSIEDKG